jgi:hypothetical protein
MDYKNKKFRHELKYYINYYEYTVLQKRLKIIMVQDPFADSSGSYHVRSLYFDDFYDSALYDKNFGVPKREKYRIRIYNKNDGKIRLERKAKNNQYICKESFLLSRNQYERIINNDTNFLLNMNGDLYKDFYLEIKNSLLSPKIIVDYDREAYIFNAGNVRITFDMMLRSGINSIDIFDENLVTVRVFKEPVMILEVKYDEFLPGNIMSLIQITSHENCAISKYVMCRLNLGGKAI